MGTRTLGIVLALALVSGCAAGPTPSHAPPARVQVTGGATTGPLRLDRVEITLDNGFGSATVERNGTLTARAVVRFSGNGVFRATWLVDGRPHEQMQRLVTYGTTMTFEAGHTPPFPTFEPGNHTVTLRIDEPTGGIGVPTVRYFVR